MGTSRNQLREQSPFATGQPRLDTRRGAVAVEFAIVAPVLVGLVFGMIQIGRMLEVQNLLDVAAREGARFASIDRSELLAPGESANEKLIDDVKNFLATNSIPKDAVTVEIKDHDSPATDFDLDDPANDLKLFEVRISVNWSEVSLRPVTTAEDHPLTAKVVFRNGRATISQ